MHNYRQGDVPLMPYTGPLDGFAEVKPDAAGKHVLALGEATGHHHRFEHCTFMQEGSVRMFRDFQTGAQVVEIPAGGASLVHEEHTAIGVPAGRYLQLVQVEDDGELIAQVAD
jgi:hypothetical protein